MEIPCRHVSRARHLIENFYSNLKRYRRIAARYDKTDHCFAACSARAANVE
jgi:transposase